MTDVDLREPTDEDWTEILRVANEALPHAIDGNSAWLANRRARERAGRRHYVAEINGRVVGYGAIEADAEAHRHRFFVVASPEHLNGSAGYVLYARLLDDLHDIEARMVWMREEASDRSIRQFALAHGFRETQRFTVDSVDVVVFELDLAGRKASPP